jgi:DNA topoisomerase VI subunit B
VVSKSTRQIKVQSHVARDLLQSSAVFEHERLVVWEYVSNGLDYVDANVKPVVKVLIDNKRKTITCSDNGRGMDLSGLQNYFTMHGENVDRKNKRRVRGFFGTGKSAAFGIASILCVTSVHKGKRSKVELTKKRD